MNICIDTNVCLRFLVGDDPQKLTTCRKLFEIIDQGKIRPYISSIVLLEIYWVLTSFYRNTKHQVQEALEKIMSIRGLVIVEKTDFRTAFALHQKTGMKLVDCLIATQVGRGIVLCTYDSEFKKISSLTVATPEQVIK
ncbi:PIN domain-containing protein [Candidatus Gottesmanbacteria bacterium]|nr:PIN domain-containing protein [Candidatus Gottesmanbacteria bacterium]